MCSHRNPGRWGKVWNAWILATAGSFAVAETVALVRDGVPATLSAHLRRVAGLEPYCAHGRVGRGVILAACAWCGVHLGFGILGIRPSPR
jgi:hypothetical protein